MMKAIEQFKQVIILPNIPGYYFAGGAVRSLYTGEDINDFDVFCETQLVYNYLKLWLDDIGEVIFKSDNDTKYDVSGYKIDLIKHVGSIDDTLDRFDFICTQFACYPDLKVITRPDAVEDAFYKLISFNNTPEDPIGTYYRVFRYIDKGYLITHLEQSKLLTLLGLEPRSFYDTY